MRSLNSKRRLTWRTMPVLIAGLLAGAVLVQPAVAHVTRSLKHLTKHLDPRYYNVGEKVGDADTLDGVDSSGFARTGAAPSAHNHDDRYLTETESDARYLQNQGSIKWSALKGWVVTTGTLTRDDFFGHTEFAAAGAQSATLTLIPDAPVTLYGKSMNLMGMQLCYNATHANVVLSDVQLISRHANNATSTTGTFVVNDATDRNDNTCATFAGTPFVLAPNAFIEVVLNVNYTGAGDFDLTRTTFFMEPTGSEAPPARATSTSVKTGV